MAEQEKLEKEALALEALEEISGGLSAAGIKKGVKSAGKNIKKGCGVLVDYAKNNPKKTAAIISTLIGAGAFAHGEYKHGGRLVRDLLRDEGDPAENFKDWLQRTEDHEEVRPTGYNPIHPDDTFPDHAGDD